MRYTTWYEVEMVKNSSAKLSVGGTKFDTYEEAYVAMCRCVMEQIKNGYNPTHWRIMRHDYTEYNGTRNEMVKPVWE